MANAAVGSLPLARTYTVKYSQDSDVLAGEYSHLYDRYGANQTQEAIEKHVVTSSSVIPKVFLIHTVVNGKPTISAFHRPSSYLAHPIHTTPWDGQPFVFRGDVMAARHPKFS